MYGLFYFSLYCQYNSLLSCYLKVPRSAGSRKKINAPNSSIKKDVKDTNVDKKDIKGYDIFDDSSNSQWRFLLMFIIDDKWLGLHICRHGSKTPHSVSENLIDYF